MSLLAVDALGVRFGGVVALADVRMTVGRGSVHGLIGPNGAGKTTLLNCIGRAIVPAMGTVRFEDRDLLALAPHALAAAGIARTFQNLALMNDRTALDNVMVGLPARGRGFGASAFLPLPGGLRGDAADRARAHEALARLGLDGHADRLVKNLPYGIRKSIEIARALCAQPRLLMLDEPTAGLHPSEMRQLASVVRALNETLGLTILLITHHLEFLLEVAHAVTVLDLGRVIADGPPRLVQTDERVRRAYLGTDE